MNIHEYQGKAILSQFGVAVPAGIVIDDVQKPRKLPWNCRKKQEQTAGL